MWTLKRSAASASIGESSATAIATRPATKSAARQSGHRRERRAPAM
jgi:hypothetical protein